MPLHANPVDTLNSYVENMGRFLGQHDILHGPDGMVAKMGAVKIAEGGPRKPPEGYVKLEGNLATERGSQKFQKDLETGRTNPKEYTRREYFAPKGAATIYNRHVSQANTNPLLTGYLKVSNAQKLAKLGLSGYHALSVTKAAMASQLGRAVELASQRKLGQAAVALAGVPGAPVTGYLRGRTLVSQSLRNDTVSAGEKHINELYQKAGGRFNMDKVFGTRASGSYFNSLKRGTLKTDLLAQGKTIISGDRKILSTLGAVGDVVQASAAPLFEEYIPRVKQGMFAHAMEDFVKNNPEATAAQETAHGRKMLDSMDNRFGEMNRDNMFWSKVSEQVSRAILLAPDWNIGGARELGGGIMAIPKSIKGIATGAGVDTRTAYAASLLGINALLGATTAYFAAGVFPEGMDFIAGRTGGTTQYSDGQGGIKTVPERASYPGEDKEMLNLATETPQQLLASKGNPTATTFLELWNNQDWRTNPIFGKPADVEASGPGKYALEKMLPIGVDQMVQGRQSGSKIGGFASFMGVRPAARRFNDPEGQRKMQEDMGERRWKKKAADEKRDALKRAVPDDVPPWEIGQ